MTSPRAEGPTPVCVLGLGLIGGSLVRALTVAGREVFGVDQAIDTARAARTDGFDAGTDVADALSRAAATDALVVLAVPVPALPAVLGHVRDHAPRNPLTDVVGVKAVVTEAVARHGLLPRYVGGHPMAGTAHSGWPAGDARLFAGSPWVVGVDDHVDPQVWARVMHVALDCGALVVPARSDEHDVAVAAISHLPHLLAETLAVAASDVPLGFALAAGSFRDGTRVAATAPGLVAAMCEANAPRLAPTLDRAIELLRAARDGLAGAASVAGLVEEGHAARTRFDDFDRHDVVATVLGAPGWRTELAAAGRAGGVIRSALPVLDTRG